MSSGGTEGKTVGAICASTGLALRVPATRIHAIVHGRRGITADTSARLGRYLGVSNGYWLRMQGDYDLRGVDMAVVEREVLSEAS